MKVLALFALFAVASAAPGGLIGGGWGGGWGHGGVELAAAPAVSYAQVAVPQQQILTKQVQIAQPQIIAAPQYISAPAPQLVKVAQPQIIQAAPQIVKTVASAPATSYQTISQVHVQHPQQIVKVAQVAQPQIVKVAQPQLVQTVVQQPQLIKVAQPALQTVQLSSGLGGHGW